MIFTKRTVTAHHHLSTPFAEEKYILIGEKQHHPMMERKSLSYYITIGELHSPTLIYEQFVPNNAMTRAWKRKTTHKQFIKKLYTNAYRR